MPTVNMTSVWEQQVERKGVCVTHTCDRHTRLQGCLSSWNRLGKTISKLGAYSGRGAVGTEEVCGRYMHEVSEKRSLNFLYLGVISW